MGDNSWNGYEYNCLFENFGEGLYADVARPLGCAEVKDSRGLAVADLDNDGRLDMIVANNADPPTIYMNRLRSAGDWLRVDLEGSSHETREAVGARVTLGIRRGDDEHTLSRWVEVGSGYCSQSDLRLHFGLGQAAEIRFLEVTWPAGDKERFTGQAVRGLLNKDIRLRHGAGRIRHSDQTSVSRSGTWLPVSSAARGAQAGTGDL